MHTYGSASGYTGVRLFLRGGNSASFSSAERWSACQTNSGKPGRFALRELDRRGTSRLSPVSTTSALGGVTSGIPENMCLELVENGWKRSRTIHTSTCGLLRGGSNDSIN